MVLSVGCAFGAELQVLKKRGFFTVGLDPERRFLLVGKTRSNADDFIQAIGESIPLRDDSFDLVVLFEVLEHVMKPDVVLKEISSVLKTNGILFLTVPNRFYPVETHGIQICQKQISNLMGIGIPFFSLAPNFLRRRFERARVYSDAQLVSLLRRNRFEPFIIEHLMPSLDIVQQTSLTRAIRQVLHSLSKIPLAKKLGPNVMVISKKSPT
jgi:SAM-dependent methyltransferase